MGPSLIYRYAVEDVCFHVSISFLTLRMIMINGLFTGKDNTDPRRERSYVFAKWIFKLGLGSLL